MTRMNGALYFDAFCASATTQTKWTQLAAAQTDARAEAKRNLPYGGDMMAAMRAGDGCSNSNYNVSQECETD